MVLKMKNNKNMQSMKLWRITKLRLIHIKKINKKLSNNNNYNRSKSNNNNNLRKKKFNNHSIKETKQLPTKRTSRTLSQELAIKFKISRNNHSKITASMRKRSLGMEINLEKLDSTCQVVDTANNSKSKKLSLRTKIFRGLGRN